VIVLLLALAGSIGCKPLDSFADAGTADTGSIDAPSDIGLPGDTGPDASQVHATWIKTFGDAATTAFVGNGIRPDTSGNVYVSAWLWGKAMVGKRSLGADDLETQVVLKLDPQGQLLWARQASPVDMHTSSGMLVGPMFNMGFTLDPASGSSYITGTFSGSITIGATKLTSVGKKDVYAAKLDRDGTWLWAIRGSGVEDDIAHAVTLTSYGPVVAGDFQGTASFGSTKLTSQGGADIFIAQLDYSNGAWVSALSAGSSSPIVDIGWEYDAETAWALAAGTAANVYVSGKMQPGATFGSAGTPPNGTEFIAVAAIDPIKPGPTWKSAMPTACMSWRLVVDRASGDLFVGGSNYGNSKGPFVAAIGQTGQGKWQFSAPSPEGYVFALAQDSAGDIYGGGYFNEKLELTDDGKNTMVAAGQFDGFVIKLNRQKGGLVWAQHISSPKWARVLGLATDPAGAVYATGGFTGQATFDGKTVTGQSTLRNGFVWKLSP
jgi:hypothetical protein